jgi:predicted peroxiredoxin
MSNNDTNKKVLVNCKAGIDDIEQATVAFLAAAVASTNDRHTAMFLTGGAIELATQHGVDGIEADGYDPLIKFRKALMKNGGELWVCPACASARDLDPDDLIEGAQIAGVPKVMAYIDSGAVTLM